MKLRKILRTAALSVALISWYTTANGLHQYVFGTLWHAYVISAALQGALFALSILGIELLLSLSGKPKQFGLICAWACLLAASSIFSYVYISHDVYSDQLLREDAHRVLREVCLSENYKLSGKAEELLRGTENSPGILASMESYMAQLATLGSGVDLSESKSNEKLTELKERLLSYAYTYGGTNTVQTINECIDTSNLISYLDTIQSGKFTKQDIEAAEESAEILTVAIDEEKHDKTTQKDTKANYRSEYQERLKTFISTNNPDYQRLNQMVIQLDEEIQLLDENISDLNNERRIIQEVLTALNSVTKDMSTSLYDTVKDIYGTINMKEVDVEHLRSLVDGIYLTLLENNASLVEDDPRLTLYSSYQDDIERYIAVINGQKQIQNEIDSLYAVENVGTLTADTADEGAWSNYWQERLNALKESAQNLQKGGLDAETITYLIHELEQKERLYLSGLNDFERAWGLLFGPHPYKSLLVFSVIFSFGIDLFSVLMSILLYLFKPKSRCKQGLNHSETEKDLSYDFSEGIPSIENG